MFEFPFNWPLAISGPAIVGSRFLFAIAGSTILSRLPSPCNGSKSQSGGPTIKNNLSPKRNRREAISLWSLQFAVVAMLIALAGCAGAPIGADHVAPRLAYRQVENSVLNSGKLSSDTLSLLHRYDLDRLVATDPDEAVRRIHQKAVATGERDLLFALAELSYFHGDRVRESVKPWDP